jgi:hypothetical protein
MDGRSLLIIIFETIRKPPIPIRELLGNPPKMVVLVVCVWWCSRSQTYEFRIVMRYLEVGYLLYNHVQSPQRSVIEQ